MSENDDTSPTPAAPAVTVSMETRRGGCDLDPPRPAPQLVPQTAIPAGSAAAAGLPASRCGGGASGTKPATAADAEPANFRLLPFVGVAAALAGAFLVYCASAPFIANALTLHGWRLWCSLALGILPVAFVPAILAVFCWRLRRLPGIEQVSESEFAAPAELRRKLAESYLAALPDAEEYADAGGFKDDGEKKTRTLLVQCIRRLQGEIPGRYAASSGWIDDFRAFQEMQDARAGEIISRYAAWTGLKTAASPWKIVDMAVVFHHSTAMIAALARLYNRKISSSAAVRLAIHWTANIYLSGQLGDVAQEAASWASDFASAALKPLAAILGKAAEGGTNAMLVARLGASAKKAFRALAG